MGTNILLEEKNGQLCFYTQDGQQLAMHELSMDTGKNIKNNDHAREKSKTLQKTYELVLENLVCVSQAKMNTVSLKASKKE